MRLPQFYIDDIIKRALAEDINYIDVSTVYLFDEQQRADAYFVAKADGVLCGIEVAMRVFELLDPTFRAELYKHDGDVICKGDRIADFNGKACYLLQGERTALNLLQHMSGVATQTHKAVMAVAGTSARIAEAEEFITQMPKGYQSYISQGGRNVSGGQKQRLALARGLLRKKSLFLFDESTSNLDKKTALKVENDFLKQKDITVIFVSHQLHEENKDRFDQLLEI